MNNLVGVACDAIACRPKTDKTRRAWCASPVAGVCIFARRARVTLHIVGLKRGCLLHMTSIADASVLGSRCH